MDQLIEVSRSEKFALSEQETALFDWLKDVVNTKQTGSILRVAGGWIRDKILGLPSDDIDIAIDNMSGEQFGRIVYDHVDSSKTVGTIKANPDQSKHLETACIKLLGYEMDLVNLRTETYTQDSRIPEISIGTASEDAFRRDLTINAMFYNIQKDTIEDYTGHGISDLSERIARTPLPPLETYLDDPLRVLRTIRFAARFALQISPEAKAAFELPEIRTVIQEKVSRERIGKEYTLMMKGPDPMRAVSMLAEAKLLEIVFSCPPDINPDRQSASISKGLSIVQGLEGFTDPIKGRDALIIMTAAFTWNLQQYGGMKDGKKKRLLPYYEYVTRYSLIFPNDQLEEISRIIENRESCAHYAYNFDQLNMGRLLRTLGERWELAFILALADINQPSQLIQVRDTVQASGLNGIWNEKPIVNGNVLKNQLGIQGKSIGTATQKVIDWQIMNRNGTTEECIQYMSEIRNEFLA